MTVDTERAEIGYYDYDGLLIRRDIIDWKPLAYTQIDIPADLVGKVMTVGIAAGDQVFFASGVGFIGSDRPLV